MAGDPPRPEGSDEDELFELFRGLRERVFSGSSELAARVLRGVEQRLAGKPEESLTASIVVQLTNLFTSWLGNEDGDDKSGDDDDPDTKTNGDDE